MERNNENYWKTKYIFEIKNKRKEFLIRIDKESFNRILPERETLPEWTDLEFYQCADCLLDPDSHSHCPAAVNVVDVIEYFSRSVSFVEADITVEMGKRKIIRRTKLQEGVGSLLGLCIAVSSCPVFGMLKPTAIFHSPFASAKKVVFRTLSTYLLAQYFRKLRGKTPDWDMEHLEKFYSTIHEVDKDFTTRLKKIHVHDASINAMHTLDIYANFVLLEIRDHVLRDLEKIMADFIDY